MTVGGGVANGIEITGLTEQQCGSRKTNEGIVAQHGRVQRSRKHGAALRGECGLRGIPVGKDVLELASDVLQPWLLNWAFTDCTEIQRGRIGRKLRGSGRLCLSRSLLSGYRLSTSFQFRGVYVEILRSPGLVYKYGGGDAEGDT